ncbi:MAG: S41 family peptidase [Tenuifilaceae bacterium]
MTRKNILLIVFAFVLFANASAQQSSSFSAYKFVRFLQYLSNEYVDTINVNKMVDEAIIKTLAELDPHSVYISKDDVRAMNEPLEGNFDGVGVEFNIMNDTLMVVNPIAGGPSERVGIIAGDRFVTIDGKNVAGIGLKNSDVFKYLRGPKGTKVNIHVKRKGLNNLLDFTITRDKIPIFSLDASYMIDSKIGYIKLSRFAVTTEQEFYDAVKKLKQQKMKDLILDLRGNGGGMLNSAVELADQFLERGKLIVYTEGRTSPRTDFVSSERGELKKSRLVILIDEGSASASEILAGAIQDWDRGIIIGRRSFGKGLVQNQMPLPDGSMIRLTIARYHTPTGRAIQRPYNGGDAENYYSDLNDRYSKGELFNQDSVKIPKSIQYNTLLKGKTVYGGGGIMPDIFVPFDTTFYSNYYGRLVRAGILNQYSLSWVDSRREQLVKEYPKFEKFNKKFSVNDQMIEEIISLGENQKINRDSLGLVTSIHEIKKQVKGLIAQSIFTNSYYFEVVNQDNNAYLKAIEVLNSWDSYKHLVNE